jgi:hypothetical protein
MALEHDPIDEAEALCPAFQASAVLPGSIQV